MNSKRQVLNGIIAILLLISLISIDFVFADDNGFSKEVEYVALSFMNNSTGAEYEVRKVTRLYDFLGNVTAYCVSTAINDSPSGYVLFSLLTDKDPIVEFSFDGIGLIDSINIVYGGKVLIKSEDQYLYLGPDLLFVKDNDNLKYLDIFTGVEYTYSDIESMFGDATVQNRDYDNGGGIMPSAAASVLNSSIYKITGFDSPYYFWRISDLDPNNGNTCSPTCATNIIWYWAIKRGCSWVQPYSYSTNIDNARAVFAAMKLAMGTSGTNGTADSMIPTGYSDYFEIVCGGDNYSITNVVNNSYSSFVDALDDNCPIHVMLRPNSSPFCLGHDVMAYGYAESTTGTEYLMVMDGWNADYRILQFSYYTYDTRLIKGHKIWIGESAYE